MAAVQFKRLSDNAVIPTRGTALSAGFDLSAAETIKVSEPGLVRVPTNIAVKVPNDYYGRIVLRSGFSIKAPFIGTAGVIDADYRGDVIILLQTTAAFEGEYVINKGDKIAQLVIERIYTGAAREVDEFDDEPTIDKHLGFGSTGGDTSFYVVGC